MAIVWTIEEKCKRCYSCIRECPAKAIKVEKGQAKVIEERCVACGHCVKVCSQKAKAVLRSVDQVLDYLKSGESIAMLAPSFAAAFDDISPDKLIGGLRATGFSRVVEVAFGADLVNRAYQRMIRERNDEETLAEATPIIASSCPAIVSYIKKYAPELLPNLAPVVSPMIAAARMARKKFGENIRIVFIGPCSAKKVEIQDDENRGAVDQVLTFDELIELWDLLGVDPHNCVPSDFDEPHAFLGRAYPLSGGLLRSAGLSADILDVDMLVTEGKKNFLMLIDSLKKKQVNAKLIDVLFCDGCINGPYMDHGVNYFARKQRIVHYTERARQELNYRQWRDQIGQYEKLPLKRGYRAQPIVSGGDDESAITKILNKIEKYAPHDELNCGACGYDTCREYARAVHQGLAETEMCLPFVIEKKERIQKQLQESLDALAETQAQLIQHEKLASIGQLAAGVAHEVNNPLGSIVLFAHLVKQKLAEDNPSREDLSFIIEEAKRCQKIISGLLNFSRQGQLSLKEQNIADIINKLIKAVRQLPQFKDIDIRTYLQPAFPLITVDGDQLYQVLLNLALNAADAMPHGGVLIIRAHTHGNQIEIFVEDTGTGIEKENISKIFTPFFTTKQMGKSSGLGLPIAYGIVKMHNGSIQVHSTGPGQGTTFLIRLPISQSKTETKVEEPEIINH